MDTKKFKMGWLVVAFDLPVKSKEQRRKATDFRNFLGRRLPDDSIQRLCARVRDLLPAGDAYREVEEISPARRECARDFRDAPLRSDFFSSYIRKLKIGKRLPSPLQIIF